MANGRRVAMMASEEEKITPGRCQAGGPFF